MLIVIAILTLIAGIGVFLVACKMLSTSLESASSAGLKRLFAKMGNSKWLGVGIGTVGTAAIQSSGAVTVMVIGFVNVGIMSLAQAATVIYGANIGTTVTAQLVALGMFGGHGISTTVLFSAFAGIGAFVMMFSKRDKWKQTGSILAGFGLLFVGLGIMSGAMDEFAALDSVKQFLATISNPLLIVFIGADVHRHHHGGGGTALARPRYLPHDGFQHRLLRGGDSGRYDQWPKRQTDCPHPFVFQCNGCGFVLAHRLGPSSFHPRGLGVR